MRYPIIIEKTESGYGAYAPDLPGLGVVGDTQEEVLALIRKGIDLHIDGLRADGLPVPEPAVAVDFVDTAA